MKRRRSLAVISGTCATLLGGALGLLLWFASPGVHQGRPLQHWLAASVSDDYRDRLSAAAALEGLGPEALPELARALRARDSWLTIAGLRAWRWMRPSFKRQDIPREQLALAAARELARLGPMAAPAGPALRRALDRGGEVGAEAARALVRGGGQNGLLLIEALRGNSPAIRRQVLEALRDGPAPGWDTPAQTAMVTALLDLRHPPRGVSLPLLIQTLVVWGAGDERVPHALADVLSGGDVEARLAAAHGLASLGEQAGQAAPAIVALLDSPLAAEQYAAALALWRITADPSRVVPVLASLVRSPEVGWRAAHVLGEIGPAAKTAVPVLLEVLQTELTHRPSRTPSITAIALGKIGGATPEVIRLLEHPNASVRMNAAATVQVMGSAAADATPALVAMLRAPDPEERMTAANALAAVGPAAAQAASELDRLAHETSGDVLVGHVASSARAALRRVRPEEAAP